MITIYTDGSYDIKNNVGGWSAIISDEHGHEKTITGQEVDGTSNRMELTAVLQGLFTLSYPTEVLIVTDSKYVEDPINKGWLERWVKDNEIDRPHYELWRMLYNLLKIHKVTVKWVRAHADDEKNNRCDKLANNAMNDLKRKKSGSKPPVTKPTKVKKAKAKKSTANSYYAVAVGRKVGIVHTWEECSKLINKYSGAKYKKFENENEAKLYIQKKKR